MFVKWHNNFYFDFRRQEEEAKRRQGNADGGGGGGPEGDFMSEAKDWAGELISGQTGTGRILVRNNILFRGFPYTTSQERESIPLIILWHQFISCRLYLKTWQGKSKNIQICVTSFMDYPSDVFWGIFETGNSCINTYYIQMLIDYVKAYEELYLKEFLIKWSGLSKNNNGS